MKTALGNMIATLALWLGLGSAAWEQETGFASLGESDERIRELIQATAPPELHRFKLGLVGEGWIATTDLSAEGVSGPVCGEVRHAGAFLTGRYEFLGLPNTVIAVNLQGGAEGIRSEIHDVSDTTADYGPAIVGEAGFGFRYLFGSFDVGAAIDYRLSSTAEAEISNASGASEKWEYRYHALRYSAQVGWRPWDGVRFYAGGRYTDYRTEMTHSLPHTALGDAPLDLKLRYPWGGFLGVELEFGRVWGGVEVMALNPLGAEFSIGFKF